MKFLSNFNFNLLKRVLILTVPFKSKVWFAVFTTISLAILSPVRPWLIEKAINVYAANNDLNGLVNISIIILVLILISGVLQFFNEYITGWIAQGVIKILRLKIFNHIVNSGLKYHDKTPVGTMTTRAVSDIETVAELFAEGIITIIGDLLQIIAITAFMLAIDWKLTLVALSVLPLLFYASHLFRIKVKSAFESVRTAVANMNAYVQEHLTGMQLVQVFGKEQSTFNEFKAINQEHYKANHNSVLYYSVFFPVIEVITSISLGLMVWWGTRAMVGKEIVDIGTITAFILYINMFFRPIRILADRFNNIQMGLVAAERIFKLLDNSEFQEKQGLSTGKISGKVEFKNVWFAYNENEFVLKDINFTLEAGKTLAIVGATGAGKSSIINLLSGLYPINKGEILIDDELQTNYNQAYLRSKIAVVLQDVFLFSGSIMDNIRLYNPNITDEAIYQATAEIGATDFIQNLPNTFDFKVMERGSTLSLGQRQLIAFIRAMAFNPNILILDEATSSIDTNTEILIQNAIKKMLMNRTSIVIAHRLSTIKSADNILVLNKGEIIEYGTHESLLERKGYYSELINASVVND